MACISPVILQSAVTRSPCYRTRNLTLVTGEERRERNKDVDRFVMYLVIRTFRRCRRITRDLFSLSLFFPSFRPFSMFPGFSFALCSQASPPLFSVTSSGQFSPLEDIFRYGPLLSCYLLRNPREGSGKNENKDKWKRRNDRRNWECLCNVTWTEQRRSSTPETSIEFGEIIRRFSGNFVKFVILNWRDTCLVYRQQILLFIIEVERFQAIWLKI